AGTPASARPDAAADRLGPAEAKEAKQESGAGEEEAEQAAPSPWNMPLTLRRDLHEVSKEADERQPTGGESRVGDGGTGAAPAAGTLPATDTAGFDVWSRAPRSGGAEQAQTAPAEAGGDRAREEPEGASPTGVGADAAGASEASRSADGDS